MNKLIHITHVSKFSAGSWGIPTSSCISGKKYKEEAKKTGIPFICSLCYADMGRLNFGKTKSVLQENLKVYRASPDAWVNQISLQITFLLGCTHFRWFPCGDLQSERMLHAFFTVAEKCPETKFWLPTQEYQMVLNVCEEKAVPPNLNIRISSPIVDKIPNVYNIPGITTSMVCYRHPVNCPAHLQEGKCEMCKKCWDREVKTVAYPLKVGSTYWPKSTAERLGL